MLKTAICRKPVRIVYAIEPSLIIMIYIEFIVLKYLNLYQLFLDIAINFPILRFLTYLLSEEPNSVFYI